MTSILPSHEKLSYVLGAPGAFSVRPMEPFSRLVRQFLGALSAQLIADADTRTMPDVMAFAWWCRKANLERMAATYHDDALRLGRGVAFHIPPSNMPVNFAFSWAFSLLAGNANVVRLPNRDFAQIPFLLRHVFDVLKNELFTEIRAMNAFVTYGREEEINEALSAIADVRIVWGGDATIRAIRKHPLPPRSVDLGFADRYSFCVIGASEVLGLDEPGLAGLSSKFFNDAYIMDQNACSSPRLIVWVGNETEVERAGERFWNALGAEVRRRYELPLIGSIDKFTQACRDAIDLACLTGLQHHDSRLYRVGINALFSGIENRRCNSGYFYEYATAELDDIAAMITSRYQTLTYFGLVRETLTSFVRRNRILGIDRIVPVGQAMDIGLTWDGYDLISMLSRVCDIR